MKKTSGQPWDTRQAELLYGFKRWGGKHFSADASGYLCVHPRGDERGIRILDVIEEAAAMGLRPPLTIRFQDLLRQRVDQLHRAFHQAIAEEEYPARYRGVFPVKVNQLREVVEEILDAGEPCHFGLEAGSKPELLIALAMHGDPESLIVCNGYKDEDFIRLALAGRKLGKEIFLVVEQPGELDIILRLAREMDVAPLLGVRVKLHTVGEGKWARSSGEEAKFGLNAPEIVALARKLKRARRADSLRMVHFHVGSQIPNILTIKKAVSEAARYFCELAKMGFPMRCLDVGGGLGIDYDGSRANYESSMNYSMEEYARDIVFNVKEVCEAAQVAPPDLISESGRALVAPHSVLAVEVCDRVAKAESRPAKRSRGRRHPILEEFDCILGNRSRLGPLERFHDALQKKQEALELFTHGYLGLATRAEAETLFWEVCRCIRRGGPESGYVPEELAELDRILADQYVCNFSVFQSLLDHWACKQLFPVAPLHRLDEKPSVPASLADISCDSEGKIEAFIDLEEDSRPTLPLHPLDGRPYYLGVFLVGAYQDIMGDFHNLFGRVNEVHVFLEEDEESGFYIEETIHGSRVDDVLGLIQFQGRDLARLMKKQIDNAAKEGRVKPREGVRLLEFYQSLLSGPTYLQLGRGPKKKREKNTTGKPPC